jgi:DNA polymerase-3 subunit alpha
VHLAQQGMNLLYRALLHHYYSWVSEKPFVHLHTHTCYSLLDGACRIKDLVAAACKYDMPAIAMTDHGVMYGAVEFYRACKKATINPVIGCETYITPGSRHDRGKESAKAHHLVLLATNETGYYNLAKLTSRAHTEGFYYKPRIDRELLAAHSDGLIGLAACLNGEVNAQLVNGNMDEAVRIAGEYAEILGKDNFFLEVQDHGMQEQRRVNAAMPELIRRTGLRVAATNDVHYINKTDARAHEILLCLQTQTVLSDPKRMSYPSDEFYFKKRSEMEPLFADFPGALDVTTEIAERCQVELQLNGTEHLHFPTFPIPEVFDRKEHFSDYLETGTLKQKFTNLKRDFEPMDAYLMKLAADGLRKHYGLEELSAPKNEDEKTLKERIDYEFGVIKQMDFVNYFLVVQDFINHAKRQRIPVGPGRGSGAGSLMAYALGITALDPLEYSLIFERFLNPERVSPPDFDIDFCQGRRGEVIEYVKDKYGRDMVAQIATFGTLGAKTLIRDIGRVLEIPFDECDKISKTIPEDPKITIEKALENSPDFKKVVETNPAAQRIMQYAPILEGLPRNTGMHAAGIVIGEKPLEEIVPLCRDKNGEPVTQYEKVTVEDVGLLKMDFLGLKTLTQIQEAVDNVKLTHGIEIDVEELPLDDLKTYELLQSGDAVGVFQLESGGMRRLLRDLSPTCIQDLIALIALYRPGPMDMIPDFIGRKHGRVRITYDHPLLEPILEETYGVMIYQEQVQQAANSLAGFSLGQGDILRRAMGKKKPEEMAKQRKLFVDGCKSTNNIDPKLAGSIFDNIEKFAGYGFNKSHSAAYGFISYWTAYFKAHYLSEFIASQLTMEMGNAEKLPVFLKDAKEHGILVLPPDINESRHNFTPLEKTIRYGLAGIKGVGEGAAKALVAERDANGPYRDLLDFCTRLYGSEVNKKVMESLARAGAFDGLGLHRARVLAGIEFGMARAASNAKDAQSGQGNLFDLLGGCETEVVPEEEIPDCPAWSRIEELAMERELLGVYISGHPLSVFEHDAQRYGLHSLMDLRELDDKSSTRIAGVAVAVQRRFTRKKQPMLIITLEDLDTSLDVLCIGDSADTYADVAAVGMPLLVAGDVSRRGEGEDTSFFAKEIYRLEDAPKQFATEVRLTLDFDSLHTVVPPLRKTLRLHPGPIPVFMDMSIPGSADITVEADPSFKVTPNSSLLKALHEVLPEQAVSVKTLEGVFKRPQRPRFQQG